LVLFFSYHNVARSNTHHNRVNIYIFVCVFVLVCMCVCETVLFPVADLPEHTKIC